MTTPRIHSSLVRGSKLERQFALRWTTERGARPMEREVQFAPGRKFRFDFADPQSRVAIELDGGLWRGAAGGHTSGAGATRDRLKDFLATISGWTVFRLTPEMAKDRATLEAIADFINRRLAHPHRQD